jgi:hypothetical protein
MMAAGHGDYVPTMDVEVKVCPHAPWEMVYDEGGNCLQVALPGVDVVSVVSEHQAPGLAEKTRALGMTMTMEVHQVVARTAARVVGDRVQDQVEGM